MSEIPTAREFLFDYSLNNELDFLTENSKQLLSFKMIEFTELHVKAALEEALDSIPCLGSSSDIATYEEVREAVLDVYPLNNIK